MALPEPLTWPPSAVGRDRYRSALGLLGWALALAGFAWFGSVLWTAIGLDGGRAYDAHSYWLAGRHVLDGQPLYAPVQIGDPGAYRYLPTFAYTAVPFALLPEMAFAWAYRIACLLCLRYLVGSWRVVGWTLLLSPVWIELLALNVTFPVAAASRWALRGGGVSWLPAATALKYGSVLLVPYVAVCRPGRRGALAIGVALMGGVLGLHLLLDAGTWSAYFASLAQQAEAPNTGSQVGDQLLTLVPSTLGDFVLRLVFATVLVIVAIRRRWAWLAFTAATLAVPTLWLARLAPLVAVPRLWLEDRAAAAASSPAPGANPGVRPAIIGP